MKKRSLSVLIALLLMLSIVSGFSITANAADDYPANLKAGAQDTIIDQWNFFNRECTSFTAWCLNSRNGVDFHNYYGGVHWGHALNWGPAARSIGITVDNNPAIGSVAWTDTGEWGHVAWVSAVNGSQVTIEEYNWATRGGYGTRTVSKSSFKGYIHIKDINSGSSGSSEVHGKEMSVGYNRTIPDGDYLIVSSHDPKYYLDIEGNDDVAPNGTNVSIFIRDPEANPKACDVFTFRYDPSDKFYTITQRGTQKALDVRGGSTAQGTNVQVYNANGFGTSAQKWAINDVFSDNGKWIGYRLVAKCSGFCLDITGGDKDDAYRYGTNVQTWTANNTPAQSWLFIPYKPEHSIPDGDYQIVSYRNPNYYLDIEGNDPVAPNGTNISLFVRDPEAEPKECDVFTLKNDPSDNYYTITQKGTSKALDVRAGSKEQGANVQLYNANGYGTTAQKWAVVNTYNMEGKWIGYRLEPKCSGLSMDITGGDKDDAYRYGTNVQMWTANSTQAQSWLLIPYKPETPIPEGDYLITSYKNAGFYLDIEGNDPVAPDGTNISLFNRVINSTPKECDVFTLKIDPNDHYYTITQKGTSKALAVQGKSKERGANVQLGNADGYGTTAQKWTISRKYIAGSPNGFQLKPKCSGIPLEIKDGDTDAGYVNGKNIQMGSVSNSLGQSWMFSKYEPNASIPSETASIYNKGEIVRFGHYEQDNNFSNGKEPIEWHVLDKKDGKILLISEKCLDCQPYNKEAKNVTWETSSLRQWLNSTFITNAFSESERARILSTSVKNDDNPNFATKGGNDTIDRVFLLSIAESRYYMVKDAYRKAVATAYANSQGAYIQTNSNGSYWWLRSPGECPDYAANIYYDGSMTRASGNGVENNIIAVRPALWIADSEITSVASITLNKTSVTLTPGASVKLTAVVNPDNASDKNVIWSSSNTAVAAVSNGMVTAGVAGTATITATAGGKSASCIVTVKTELTGKNFTDVYPSDYYANAVNWAVQNKITNGLTDTLFGPSAGCTRGQVVTFLWRAAGEPSVNVSRTFKDVSGNEYYAKAVSWAVSKGITNGMSNDLFEPDTVCTRAHIITFLWRYVGQPKADTQNRFTDVSPNAYYAQAVNWAVSKGITRGTSDTKFSPTDTCTRGQVVTFLYRALA